MSVLTAGETMVLLDPVDDGAFHSGMPLTLRIAAVRSTVTLWSWPGRRCQSTSTVCPSSLTSTMWPSE